MQCPECFENVPDDSTFLCDEDGNIEDGLRCPACFNCSPIGEWLPDNPEVNSWEVEQSGGVTPKQLYKLAYQLVRLKTYEGAVAADWDYAHNPTDEEQYHADLYQDVINNCNRQREAIEPLVPGHYEEAAFTCYKRRHDKVPSPKLAHLANNWGAAPFSHMPWRTDERDYYIGHYDFRLESPWMGEAWNRDNRERFIRRAREVFGLVKVEPPPTDLDEIPF